MSTSPWVLGISSSHNGAACLLHGDEIVAAVQDERLMRFKRQAVTPRFARHCVEYCLEAGGIGAGDLDLIVSSVTRGDGPQSVYDTHLNESLRPGRSNTPVISVPHHYAHAVSAFATSGFRDAAILVIDGSGTTLDRLPVDERATVISPDAQAGDLEWLSYYEAEGTRLRPMLKQTLAARIFDGSDPDRFGSLGDMYGAVGRQLFGSALDGAGKVMGLAPYGTPDSPVDQWLQVSDSGLVRFGNEAFLRASHRRWPGDFAGCANLAASVQRALEHALLAIASVMRSRSSTRNLCYAGGVALNSVANECLVREGGFENVFIFPPAEDSGVAVGAAYHGLWQLTRTNTQRRLHADAMGRQYDERQVDRAIAAAPAVVVSRAGDPATQVARLLCEGQIVAWFAGRSELGPRSLGQRAILCDPRRADAKDLLNSRVKHREPFRPFAPIVMHEHVADWFDVPPRISDSPFMLRVWRFQPGKAALVPAVAHVDNTARVQTLTRVVQPLLYEVINAFYAKTGVPMLLNTSFNVAGEPIVETPEDALACLLATGIDCCVFGDRLVHKRDGFSSVLDLRPRLQARRITVEMPVIDGRIVGLDDGAPLGMAPNCGDLNPFEPMLLVWMRSSLQAKGSLLSEPVASATVAGPYGEISVCLTGEYLKLLASIDGVRDGHALLRTGNGWSAAWLQAALTKLARASLISFSWTAELSDPRSPAHRARRTPQCLQTTGS